MAVEWAIALHGGAGPIPGRSHAREEAHLAELVRRSAGALADGESALNVAHSAVATMEASGLFLAGRGAQPSIDGAFELDAAIMDGPTKRAGAVGALTGFESPIGAARVVMERTPNVLIVGKGAERLMRRAGMKEIEDPAKWFTPSAEMTVQEGAPLSGTVGAVVRDKTGALAAATSTAGIGAKTPGRLGDTPLIGAGTWADRHVAVSCTGLGEYFIRANAAADLSARLRYNRQALDFAARDVLAEVKRLGGEGGLIAVNADGWITALWNSSGLKRALADSSGRFEVGTFE